MPAANVRTFEKALTPRVGGNEGVYNSIVIPAKKGPVGEPVLVSSEGDLLDRFTPDGTVKIGYNIAYYSALAVLQQTHSLWVTRAANEALNGGVFVNSSKSSLPAYKQMQEISGELPEIDFDVSNITDGSADVDVSNLVGGTPTDLVGRTINILDVGDFSVSSVTGATLTLDANATATTSFVGTGSGVIQESVDYASFDADFGAGGNSTSIEATNYSDATGTVSDLLNTVVSFVADGAKFTRTVTNVTGTTLTVDSVTPAITNQNGSGYRGSPEITCTVSDIAENKSTMTISNIAPAYVTINDFNAKTLAVTADMSDSSTLSLSSVVSNPNGAEITFDDGVDNPGLVNSSTGFTPYTPATADGFEDAAGIAQPVGDLVTFDANDFYTLFSLYSVNEGDWSKDIFVEIVTEGLRTPDAFEINVYTKNDLVRPAESFICSRDPERKDGYERNIFIETSLQASRYIRAINNPLMPYRDVAGDINIPKETVSRDILGNIIGRSFMTMVGGDDGDAVTSSHMIEMAQKMDNKNNYPLTVMLDGGWAEPGYQQALLQICEKRDDAFAVLSVPFILEMDPVTYITDIVEYRNYILNANSSYGALYSSHVKITDKYNDREIFVAPDGFAAAAINLSASAYEIWYPPAGYRRGRMFVNDVHVKFTDGDLDYLADNGINQIRFAPGKGIAIWGQLTLAIIPSAFDRMNVRLLLNELKPAITAYLERYLFELNTEEVRLQIRSSISSYLTGIVARNGIKNFEVVCNDTNNTPQDEINNTLNVDVYIQPVYSIEFINFTTILRHTGISFNA